MQHYNFSNIKLNEQFIFANVYKDNNYIFKIEVEILQLEYTQDIQDILYQEFREFAFDYLNYNAYIQEYVPTKIINFCHYNIRKGKHADIARP